MKKIRWILAVPGLVLLLAGCSVFGGKKLVPNNIKNVKVTYEYEDQKVSWYLKTSKINQWKKWAQSLSYEPITFEKGKSPNDTKKGERYTFQVNDGETSFSYMDPDNNYILLDKKWYFVSNPTDPPVLRKKTDDEVAPIAGPGEVSVSGSGGTIKAKLQKGWNCITFPEDNMKYYEKGIYGMHFYPEGEEGYIEIAYYTSHYILWDYPEMISKKMTLSGEKAEIRKLYEGAPSWEDIIFKEKKKNIVVKNVGNTNNWTSTYEKQIFKMVDSIKYEKNV